MSRTSIARINYTNKDFEEIRDALITRIPKLTTSWTDFNTSDIGITLLELYCGISDLLLFYLDHQANEAYLQTARERKNVLRLARLIGYKMESLSAASATVTFSIGATHIYNIRIPRYTRMRGSNGYNYVTDEETTLLAGSTSVDVTTRQGNKREETITHDGSADYSYTLTSNIIAENTLRVLVGDDETEWTEVLSFIDSTETDLHYVREIDEDNLMTVTFGDGTYGKIPNSGTAIKFVYIETDGVDGNIGGAKVTSLIDKIYDVNGTRMDVSVSNSESFTGGGPKEVIEETKVQAPAELYTLDRMVTLSDYETLIQGYPGIKYCQAVDINDDETIPFRYVKLYAVPEGGGQISSVMETELIEYVDNRLMVGNVFSFEDVTYVTIDVTMEVYLTSSYSNRANEVKASIVTLLEDMFSLDNQALDQDVRYSTIAAAIQDTDGVAYLTLSSPSSNQPITYGEIAVLGDVTITIGGSI